MVWAQSTTRGACCGLPVGGRPLWLVTCVAGGVKDSLLEDERPPNYHAPHEPNITTHTTQTNLLTLAFWVVGQHAVAQASGDAVHSRAWAKLFDSNGKTSIESNQFNVV